MAVKRSLAQSKRYGPVRPAALPSFALERGQRRVGTGYGTQPLRAESRRWKRMKKDARRGR